ncbi:hypothetical protein P692DRAFT_20830111 [Suillus brevipes Sb2]|nr:hypothetical protein P692DRAFT_20830111 [Suillus brevipes Sb2]
MFVRVFLVSVILLLISQVSVMASTDSTQCGQGTARCCQEETSQLGNVNDEACQSYSDPCPSGYLSSCCYTVPDIVSAMIQFNSEVDLT